MKISDPEKSSSPLGGIILQTHLKYGEKLSLNFTWKVSTCILVRCSCNRRVKYDNNEKITMIHHNFEGLWSI